MARQSSGHTLDPHPSREPRAATLVSAVTARARAAALAAALVLLGFVAPAQVRAVEELLETLVPPANGTPATGTVSLRVGDTLRVVVTGIVTRFPDGSLICDALFCFTPGLPEPVEFLEPLVLEIGGFFISFRPPPPPDPVGHRYEKTFVANTSGVLSARFRGPFQTSTIRVEHFGERTPDSCDGRPATIVPDPNDPLGTPIFGTRGNDVIVGTEGNDQLFGRGGKDIICGFGGNDLILGNAGRDRLFGGPGDDQILGGDDDARDILQGDDGQDRLVGGRGRRAEWRRGADRMIGGPGDDTLFVGGQTFSPITLDFVHDVVLGGPGEDLADYSQSDLLALPELPDVGVAVNLRLGPNPQVGGEILRTIENLRGTDLDDNLKGDNRNNILFGGADDDELFGGGGRDILRGEGGEDRLFGDTGPDVLKGGADRDLCCVDSEDDRRRRGDCEKVGRPGSNACRVFQVIPLPPSSP